jgi:hypothetical protein
VPGVLDGCTVLAQTLALLARQHHQVAPRRLALVAVLLILKRQQTERG